MATKLHLDDLGQDVLDFIAQLAEDARPWSHAYVLLDVVSGEPVPGQADTFYIQKGATLLGHNVRTDSFGNLKIRLLNSGQELRLGFDFNIVRSLSTGIEGFAAVGSTNAIQFTSPPFAGATYWYSYHRAGGAVP